MAFHSLSPFVLLPGGTAVGVALSDISLAPLRVTNALANLRVLNGRLE